MTAESAVPSDGAPKLDAAQLAEAFAIFNRASEELSSAYNGLQVKVGQLNERLSVLMEALPAGVLVLDRNDIMVQVNRAAESWLGTGRVGQAWPEVGRLLDATETPGEFNLGDGDALRRVSLSETVLESGEGRIVLLHDITETYRMRRTSERNQRLAAMGEMVAGLAHQLRTPLAAALLYTGNLMQPELGPAERNKLGGRALERLRYLERLIRDMLLFARGDAIGRQTFDVCELAGELANTLEPLARARSVRFVQRCDCAGDSLHADRKALGGALTNLLENAIAASPAGGQVSFVVSNCGSEIVFDVRDNGPGIDPSVQERLFQPFFTTRAEGTGLGLAIARGVARAHGGDITLESAPGEGACFTLTVATSAAGAEQTHD